MRPYHFDLRNKVAAAGGEPATARTLLSRLTSDPLRTNPVDVVQFGLAALQMQSELWLPVVEDTVAWVERELDDEGLLTYRFPMPHTFPLDPPWHSALAQGEAASLLVRAATVLRRTELLTRAEQAIAPLLRDASELVVLTCEGPVLQEYPTTPPAHVLNGWIAALWGMYDVAQAAPASPVAAAASAGFDTGVSTLAARLDRYRTPVGWSRYDLFPHPVVNVASLSYHRLHIGHLRALNALAARKVFSDTADAWEQSAESFVPRAIAFGRKALFRAVRPRWRRVPQQPLSSEAAC